jgi:hypothetical protein
MLVRMRRNTGGPDGIACEAGEVYDLPAPLAESWVRNGRAVFADDTPFVDPGVMTTHGDPVASHAESPKRKRR